MKIRLSSYWIILTCRSDFELVFRGGNLTFIAVQHAKEVMSDSPGLVDFEVGQVNSVFASI